MKKKIEEKDGAVWRKLKWEQLEKGIDRTWREDTRILSAIVEDG